MRNSKEGSDFIFFSSSFGSFLLTGIYSKVGSWLLSLRRWAMFVSFLHSLSLLLEPTFFWLFRLVLQKERTLAYLVVCPGTYMHNLQTSSWVRFHQLLGLPREWCDTFSPTLGTYGGHDGPLLSFSVLWGQTSSLCPASSTPLCISQAVTKDDPNPWPWLHGSRSSVADAWFAFQSWPSFCPAVFSFALSSPSGYELEGSIQTRTELKLVSLTRDQENDLS